MYSSLYMVLAMRYDCETTSVYWRLTLRIFWREKSIGSQQTSISFSSVLWFPILFPEVSVTGNAGIGMPIILLHDAEGGIVTVELKNGEVYRGLLDEAEDSMNLVLKVRTAVTPSR